MAHRWTAPARWLLVVLVLAAIVGTRAPDRLLSQWAYAVEKGKLQAVGEDLASVEEVSNAFRNVARLAQVGVVQINVAGDPNELAEVRRQVERRLDRPLTDERWQRFLREHPQGTASGILMDAQGHILTNHHVVGGKTGITVRLHDGRSYEAQVRGTDPETDIAVLKIEARELHPLRFGDSDKMEVGDWVLAVGAPLGLTHTVTHGIISAKGRSDIISGREIFFQDFFQTDAAINRGNSGGPLLNLRGEVIGLNTAVALNDDGGNAGIAFTIPSNIALHIADQLKRTGAVARGWLGVRLADLDSELVELFGLESDNGVMVDMVYANSPGQRAGLQCEDIIVEVNGVQVTGMRRLQALIGFVSPGKDADFKVLRSLKEGQPFEPRPHQAFELKFVSLLGERFVILQEDKAGFRDFLQESVYSGPRREPPGDFVSALEPVPGPLVLVLTLWDTNPDSVSLQLTLRGRDQDVLFDFPVPRHAFADREPELAAVGREAHWESLGLRIRIEPGAIPAGPVRAGLSFRGIQGTGAPSDTGFLGTVAQQVGGSP
ncbi:MAG: trypsin-like peptidase domain-containing protein [Phycisphaerae bacterium]|nr:trypsin-like peptidase domain-containing protein [Phycisphaerae bacterium]